MFQFQLGQKMFNVFDQIERIAKIKPLNTALINEFGEEKSYGSLISECEAIQNQLLDSGVGSSTRIGVYANADNASISIVASLGVCQVVPIAMESTELEILDIIRRVGLEFIIVDDLMKDALVKKVQRNGIKVLRPNLDQEGKAAKKKIRSDRTHQDVAVILQTSGTASTPKLVPVTHQAILDACMGSSKSLELSQNDRCLNFMPLTHVHGLVSGLIIGLLTGGCVVSINKYQRNRFNSWMQAFQPTWLSTTPTIYRILMSQPKAFSCPGLRFVRSGAANMPASLAKKIESYFDVPLLNAYGMTETLQISGEPLSRPKPGSVGKSIGPEILILNEERIILPPFEVGEVAVKGSSVFAGYLDEDKSPLDCGLFVTGDLGWLDEDGYLFLYGRLKEMINKGGERISPQEIEEAILMHPEVIDVVVRSIPHSTLGEDIAAVVQIKNNRISSKELKDYLSARISLVKIPSKIKFVSELPIGKNGKISKKQVQRMLDVTDVEGVGSQRPLTEVEEFVSEHFLKALNGQEIAANADFFEKGGSSLDAAVLVADIENDLGKTIHVVSLMVNPSVAEFSTFLEKNYSDALSKFLNIKIESKKEEHGLTDEQIDSFRKSMRKRILPDRVDCFKENYPVFILSSARSGSTLLRVMMAGHPEVFAPPELRLLNYLDMSEWAKHLSGDFNFFQEGLHAAFQYAFNCTIDQAVIKINEYVSKAEPIANVYKILFDKINPKVFVEKTPAYALSRSVLESMNVLFPNAKYIHLIRNPESVISSFVNTRMEQLWMYENDYSSKQLGELVWLESNQNIAEFLENIPSENKMEVRYENLVTAPNEALVQVCQLLRLKIHRGMLAPYENMEGKMVKAPKLGSKMIGDPYFLNHSGIEADTSKISARISSKYLHPKTMMLAEKLGYSAHDLKETMDKSKQDELIENIKRLTGQWDGDLIGSNSLIRGRNMAGGKMPIFWVFQGDHEFQALSLDLGFDQPLYGMRSGHLLFKKETSEIQFLSARYANEITKAYPSGQIRLGGNCQGASVAWEVAQILENMGREVAILFLMEREIIKPCKSSRLVLLFGQKSYRHNPYFFRENPDDIWREMYSDYGVHILQGGHGTFFQRENSKALAKIINTELDQLIRN